MLEANQHCDQAVVATPNARRYLSQLCKHFQHKCPVTLDTETGSITFATLGVCRLCATDDALFMILEPLEAERQEALRDVVVRHLRRFAFREDLVIDWNPAT